MVRTEKLETTLGELIVALTEETGRHVRDERATYELVAYIVNDLIDDSNRRSGTVTTH
jgi:hypothetical protein